MGGEGWEKREQLLRATWYYYVDELTQDEVAVKLGVSRVTVTRLLEKSRREGVVTFTVGSDEFDAFHVGRELREAFGLREALVPPSLDADSSQPAAVSARLARGGAQYLQNVLQPGETLALGWGETVRATMECLSSEVSQRINTVTLTGGVNAYLPVLRQAGGRARQYGDAVIPAPIVVSSEELARSLRKEAAVARALKTSSAADHAVIGIGGVGAQATIVQEGYVNDDELAEFRAHGAVGDILAMFYDANGEVLDLPVHSRRIGVDIEDLRSIPNVIGIAGGMSKVDAILGALRGGYLDVLVTTEEVARALLAAQGVQA